MGQIEQKGILWELAIKDAKFLQHEPDTAALATKFEQALRASKLFSWAGVIAVKDQLEGYSVDVYLSERHIPGASEEQLEHATEVLDLFDDLALSLESDNIIASLHLVKESECAPEQLKRKLKETCTGLKSHSLVWDEVL